MQQLVAAARCRDRLALSGRQVTAANVQDLLHIACNKSDPTAASQLLVFLQQPRVGMGHVQLLEQLTPSLLQQLLCTAVERQHCTVVEQLLRLPGILQLQPAQVAAVIQAALLPVRSVVLRAALCKPPLTRLLDAESCEGCISMSMLANSASVAHNGVVLLCCSPVARALEPAAVERLLRVALSNGGDASKGYYSHILVLPLVGLPGAQALPPSSVARLLREALLCVLHPLSRLESFTLLLTLPAASAMDMASLAGVLEATLQDGAYPAALTMFDQLTTLQLLDAATISSMLSIIVQQSCSICCALGDDPDADADGDLVADVPLIAKLCGLPAASLLEPEPLIKLALQLRALRVLPFLCRQLQLSFSSLTLLLQDAAQHKECGSLKALLSSPAALQLSKESVAQLLDSTVGQAAEDGAAAALLQLPAAQQLEVGAVAALLDTAVRQQQCNVLQQLVQLPGATQLSAQQLADLLKHALARQLDSAVEQLIKLPQAMQLELHFVAEQLTAALELGASCDCVEAMCSLLVADQARQQLLTSAALDAFLQLAMHMQRLRPVAALLCTPAAEQQLSTQRVQELLLHATQQHNDNSVEILSHLEAAADISADGVEQIINAAIRVGCCGMLMDLCELAGAATLPAAAVCRLLRAALNVQWTEGLDLLAAHLPGADKVPAGSVHALLESAIRQLDGEAAVYLLRLRGAQLLEPHMVLQLLQLALQLRLREPLGQLCGLDAARRLTAGQVEETLQLALRRRACADQAAVLLLLDLPGTQQLSSSSACTLLQMAASSGARQAVVRLCRTPAAQHIGPQAAAAVLRMAGVEQLDWQAVAALCGLPGAQQLPSSDVLSMLRAVLRKDSYAMSSGAAAMAQQLLQLPAAAAIPADELTEVLQLGSHMAQRNMSGDMMQQLFGLHAAALRRPRA
ncbi:hypothetical protein COO60DRAFT_1702389 [Scenedesmus sp. NREL 46B-D3]|nr:hypothetical protein COO60DRAFT_1702389 [Scenedesmus sp. NREL 46B-D3]